MIHRRMLVAVLLGAVSGLMMAAPLSVGPASKSTVTATFKQEGVAVESAFTSFKGTIDFDPKNVAGSSALVDIDMASLDLGDPVYNAELRKKSWFDSAAHPRAVFKSTGIKAVSAARFDATGTLTVKGKAIAITVPVAVSTAAAGPVFDGSFVISRKAFGIGDPIWEDAIDDKVTVKFHLAGGK